MINSLSVYSFISFLTKWTNINSSCDTSIIMGNIATTVEDNSQFLNSNSSSSSSSSTANPNYSTKWTNDFIKVNEQMLGQGAFGKVWIVKPIPYINDESRYHQQQQQNKQLTDRYLAMKEINLDCHIFKLSKKNLSYALEEGIKMQNLNHKNIIAYINSYNDFNEKKVFLIMEYANGGSLRERMHYQMNKQKHYPIRPHHFNEKLIWFWLLQILDGIRYIHSKDIIHRDIKPDNIFVDARNGTVKLGDFGLAKIIENENNDNVSQVGTPAYMPPEVHEIRKAQSNYNSADTINMKTAICALYSKKGDIYSFGCTIYELMFLSHVSRRIQQPESVLNFYSKELKDLIELSLHADPSKRPSIEDIFEFDFIKSHQINDYSSSYFEQMIPSLYFERNFSTSLESGNYVQVEVCTEYKPSEMISLKRDSNLIVISANKYMNKQKRGGAGILSKTMSAFGLFNLSEIESYNNHPNDTNSGGGTGGSYNDNIDSEFTVIDAYEINNDNIDQSKLLVYTEHGELIIEITHYYLDDEKQGSKEFYFQILGMCIDEINSHLYISINRPSQIYRFYYASNFSHLILDGILDLNELNQMMRTSKPTCLHLLNSSMETKDDYRILFFGDRSYRSLVSLKVPIRIVKDSSFKIKCHPLRSVTVDENLYVHQILTTDTEIFCLFNDLATIQVYDLVTYLAKRDNRKLPMNPNLRLNHFCLDSDNNFYTTNGHSFLCMNVNSLKFYQKFKPYRASMRIGGGGAAAANNNNRPKDQLFFESIAFINILTNGKLVLLKDAIQTENSELFIIKPEFYNEK